MLCALSVGVVAAGIGTAPQVLGSGDASVGVGGAGPAAANFTGGPITGVGDGGGLTSQPSPCNAATACETTMIHVAAPAGFAATNNISLTVTITWTGPPGAGLDQFLDDSGGNEVGKNTSSISPSALKADKLTPGDYTLYVVGDAGSATNFTGRVVASSSPKPSAAAGVLPTDISFAPSTVVSPTLFGQEPQMSFELPQANSVPGQVRASRGFIDWPVSSRTGIGTLWRTTNGGDSYRQLVDLTCATRQRPNCGTSGGGDTVDRVNNYDGAVMFGDQESLAAEAYAQSNDHGDSFPIQHQQAVTAAGTGVDRQWIAPVNGPGYMAGPIDAFEMEGVFSYHIPGAGQYVSGIDKTGLAHPALITTINDVGQSGPSRVDTTGGPGNGWFYQSYRGFLTTTGTNVAVVPLNQYQSPSAYKVQQVTTDSAVVFPWISLDTQGNLYAIWVSPTDSQIYMKYSLIHDHANDPTRGGVPATTWSPKIKINPPVLTSVIFPEIVAGDPGHIAITYMGTPDHSGTSSTAKDTDRWWTWVTMTTNALDPSPTWLTGPVSHRVDHLGQICTNGTTCVGQQDRSLADMIDVTMDSQGRPSVVYENNNNTFAIATKSLNQQGSPYTMFAKLASGPSLLNGKGPFNYSYPTDYIASARDDATWPNTAAGSNLPSLDILGSGVSADGSDIVGQVKLAESDVAAMTRDLGAYNGVLSTDLPADRLQYILRFESAGDVYYMGFDQDSSGNRRAYGGKVDASNAILNGSSNVGSTYDPQAAFPVTYSFNGNTLTLRAKMSTFGVGLGSKLYSLTSFSFAAPSDASLVAVNKDGTVMAIPRVVDASPPIDAVLGVSTSMVPGSNGGTITGGGEPLPNTAAGSAFVPAIPVGLLVATLGFAEVRRRRSRVG